MYFAVAIGAGWSLRRWLDRAAARDALILLALPLLGTGWAMLTGRVLAPIDGPWMREPLASMRAEFGVEVQSAAILHDVWSQMIPWHSAVRAALRAGHAPLWNPFSLGGEPLLASYQPGLLHPVRLASLVLPLPDALTLAAALTLFLAAFSMYLFVRQLGCRGEIALVAAAAWCYGAYVGFWLEWAHGLAAAGAPLVLAGVSSCARSPDRRSLGLLVWATTLLLLAGSPEASVVTLLTAAGWIALELRSSRAEHRWGAFCAIGLALTTGLGISAVQIVPFASAVRLTAEFDHRLGGWGEQGAAQGAAPAGRQILEAFLPYVHGTVTSSRTGALRPARSTSWAGGLILVAGIVGAISAVHRARGFFSLVFLIGTATAAGLPPLPQALRLLPYGSLVHVRYFWLPAGLAVVVLAALGLERVWITGRHRQLAQALALAVPVVTLSTLLLWRDATPETTGFHESVVQAAALVGSLVASATILFWRTSAFKVAVALIAVLLAERQIEAGGLYRSLPRSWFYPRGPVIAELSKASGVDRSAAVGNLLYPNLSAVWELEDVRGYNPMILGRIAATSPYWSWGRGTSEQFLRINSVSPMLSLLNVRSLLAPISKPPPGWPKVMEIGALGIFENPSCLPRVFAPKRVRIGCSREECLTGVAEELDFGNRAWIEASKRVPDLGERENGSCRLRIEESGFRYRLRALCDREAWIATSIPAWPGWKLRVDGKRRPTAVANHAFVAFRASSGSHEIALDYLPDSVLGGAWISGVALAGLGLLYRYWPVLRAERGGDASGHLKRGE